jgi:hypothetical protein
MAKKVTSKKPKESTQAKAKEPVKAKATAPVKEKPARKRSEKLEKVPVEYVFWCNDGSVFSDLEELATGLAAMSDDTYAYHCNPEKQDFVNWVREVVRDDELAAELAMAANRIQAAECAAARIAILAENM